MTFDEAFSEAVQGARISSLTIQNGAYVDYQFNGLRIVFPSGSNSGFSPTDADRAAEWTIDTMDPPTVPLQDRKPAPAPNVGKWGLPRIELGEHGVPADAKLYATTKGGGKSWAREPTKEPKTPKLSGFEIAQLEAKALQSEPQTDKWGVPVKDKEPGKWGR